MPQSDMSLASKRATYRHLQGRLSKLEKEQEQLTQAASAVKQQTQLRHGGLLVLAIILMLVGAPSAFGSQNSCGGGLFALGAVVALLVIVDRMRQSKRRASGMGILGTQYAENQRAIAELEANMRALEQEIDDALTARREGG